MPAPLSPSELARRAEAAQLARAEQAARLNGACHQDEAPAAIGAEAELAELPLRDAPIDAWFVDGAGLTRWRPVVDRISVIRHSDGSRTLILTGGYKLKLSPDCAHWIGRLLGPGEGQS